MFRTAFSSLTVTVKGFFSLKAQTIVDLNEKEALAGRVEKIISTAAFSDDDAADGEAVDVAECDGSAGFGRQHIHVIARQQ